MNSWDLGWWRLRLLTVKWHSSFCESIFTQTAISHEVSFMKSQRGNFFGSCNFLSFLLYLFSVERQRMEEDKILPFRYFLVFFLKTWLNWGVNFQLNTYWKRFLSQKGYFERLYHHLTQYYSPPYVRPSMCFYHLILTLSLSNLSLACKFASTIWVKDCIQSAHTVLCLRSTSPENPYLLFCPCLLSQYHHYCNFSLGCCQSSSLHILETTAVHSLHLSPPPFLSNKELSEAVALLSGG